MGYGGSQGQSHPVAARASEPMNPARVLCAQPLAPGELGRTDDCATSSLDSRKSRLQPRFIVRGGGIHQGLVLDVLKRELVDTCHRVQF
jgi:hypothetical protein